MENHKLSTIRHLFEYIEGLILRRRVFSGTGSSWHQTIVILNEYLFYVLHLEEGKLMIHTKAIFHLEL